MQTTTPSRQRYPMWPIYLCVAVTALGIGIVNPLIPYLLEDAGANKFIVGLTTSVMFATLALTALPIGRQIDRVGIRPFFVVGLVSYSIAMLLMPLTNRIIYFFILRGLEGLGWSAVWTAAETYVSRVSEPEKRGHNMAVYGMSLASGTAAGPLFGTVLWNFGEALPFIVAVLMAIVAGVFVFLVVPEPHLHHADHDLGLIGLSRTLMLPLLIAFLYGYGTLTLVALVPTLNYSEFQIGLLITVTVIANIFAQVPVGRLVDRFSYRPVLLASLTLLCGAALLAAIQPPFTIILFLGSLLGAFAGTLYPIGLAILAARVPPQRMGGANGMYTVFYGLGSVIGPALTGLMMTIAGDAHSDQALFGTIGCLVFLLLVALLLGVDQPAEREYGFEHEQPEPPASGSESLRPPL